MPRTRITDPDTSHEAAESVRSVTRTQYAILRLFDQYHFLTDEQLQLQYRRLVNEGTAPRASESGIRSRRKELVDAGYVFDTGRRTKMESGRNAIVWSSYPRIGASDD